MADKSYDEIDCLIEKGFQEDSDEARRFRRHATKVLKEYIIKGFALDDQRLKGEGIYNPRYFDYMSDRLAEIRISTRNSAQKITDVYAELCYDYDVSTPSTNQFYRHMFKWMYSPTLVSVEKKVLDMAENHIKEQRLLSVVDVERLCQF